MQEKTVKENKIFSGRVFKVQVDEITDYYGNPAEREIILHSGGVGVVAVDEDENIILVKQYRYAIKSILLEVPAGKLEQNEVPQECGERELIEETGYKGGKFIDLGSFYVSPGYVNEKTHLFLASELEFVGQNFDSGEYVEVEKIPLKKAYEMVFNGEIIDAKTQIGIMKAYAMLIKGDL